MNTLNRLIEGLMIGDGAIASYLHMALNKNCGGLFNRTSEMGYRKMNTKHNYPRMTSYYYIQDKLNSTPTENKRYVYGQIDNAYNTEGLNIGWAYSTDINRYKIFRGGYSSVSDFDNFQRLLRGEKWVDNNIFKKDIHNSFYEDENAERMENDFVGERYSSFTSNFKLKNYPTFSRGNNLDIKNIFKSFLPPKNSIQNFAISRYGNNGRLSSFLTNNDYGKDSDLYENEGKHKNPNSFELFSMHLEDLISILYENKYNPLEKQYVFSQGEGDIINYHINLEKNSEEFKIDKDNEGNFIDNKTNTFYFYKETDNLGDEPKMKSEEQNSVEFIGDNVSNIIKKTNNLFNSHKINTLINRFHINIDNEDISRGRNLKKDSTNTNNKESGYDNPYCRVWTAHHQYSKMKDRIRPFINDNGVVETLEDFHKQLGELRPNNAAQRLSTYSVLQPNGFVRITPTKSVIDDSKKIKNYMFSIENLAWKDIPESSDALSKEQRGPNKGRIMWFPPYNLKFSENINVNWNGNNFIGRGEQIYTYTNTERSGTLDFTLLIDHPSILNKWRGSTGDYENGEAKTKMEEMLRFFAGCGKLDTNSKTNKVVTNKKEKENGENKNTLLKAESEKYAYVVFFPNNYSGYDNKNIEETINQLKTYETSNSDKFEYEVDSSYRNQNILDGNKVNKNLYGLNESIDKESIIESLSLPDINDLGNLEKLLTIYKEDKGDTLFGYPKANISISNIEFMGFASSHGKYDLNMELAQRRCNTMKKCVEKYCKFIDNKTPIKDDVCKIIEINDIDGRGDINERMAKIARAAVVIFNIERSIDAIPNHAASSNFFNGKINNSINTSVNRNEKTDVREEVDNTEAKFNDEYLYFCEVSKDDFFVKNIVNKIRHFDPAFHSITPEGFNARLTFLQQCTRQGPTSAVNGGSVDKTSNAYLRYAGNLSFGRAPYCILRIGDFFNTKICIESISISYDNNGGVQWDLNQEGAGVQPMMANVSITFKFLGGQDISGPIERLQNAVTSNYYANASVYDYNADYGFNDNNVEKNVRKDIMLNK